MSATSMELLQHLAVRTRGTDLYHLVTELQQTMLLEALPTVSISDPVRVAVEAAAIACGVQSLQIYRGGRRGPANVSRARQLAMYLLWHVARLSLPRIAKEFGLKDHTTALRGRDRITEFMREDPSFALRVREAIARCTTARELERPA